MMVAAADSAGYITVVVAMGDAPLDTVYCDAISPSTRFIDPEGGHSPPVGPARHPGGNRYVPTGRAVRERSRWAEWPVLDPFNKVPGS